MDYSNNKDVLAHVNAKYINKLSASFYLFGLDRRITNPYTAVNSLLMADVYSKALAYVVRQSVIIHVSKDAGDAPLHPGANLPPSI
jgi:hypothetical protein